MKRLLTAIAIAIAGTLIIAGAHPDAASADEFNVGSVRMSNGTPCAPSACSLVLVDGSYSRAVATGTSRAYLGYFYIAPGMQYQYISFNANAYMSDNSLNHRITFYGRRWCGGVSYQFTPGVTFYEPGSGSAVYLGAMTLGACG